MQTHANTTVLPSRIAIDFGTCLSCAAVTGGYFGPTIRAVKDTTGMGFSFPSSVYLASDNGDTELVVAHQAESRRTKDPSRYQREFKRDLGKEVRYLLGPREFTPSELISAMLRELKSEAQRCLPPENSLDECVLTVPARYEDYRRQLMIRAALDAALPCPQLLDEPLAAAFHYESVAGATVPEGACLLIYDLGGGTFDAALLQKRDGQFEKLAQPIGIEDCGGADFDREIFSELCSQCGPELRTVIAPDRSDLAARRMRDSAWAACREIKHQLTRNQAAEVLVAGTEYFQLNRSTFEARIKPYIDSTIALCKQLIREADVTGNRSARIVMVGGSCRIPLVRKSLEALGHQVVLIDDPELAVCQGAARYKALRIEPSAAPRKKTGGYVGYLVPKDPFTLSDHAKLP